MSNHLDITWLNKTMQLAEDLATESLRLGSYERKDVYENAGQAGWQTVALQEKRKAAKERLRLHLMEAQAAQQQLIGSARCPRCWEPITPPGSKPLPEIVLRQLYCNSANYVEFFKAYRAAHGIKEAA